MVTTRKGTRKMAGSKTTIAGRKLDLAGLATATEATDEEMPRKEGVGRERQPNEFDAVVARAAKSGKTQRLPVVLDEENEKLVGSKLRSAAHALEPRKSVTIRKHEDGRLRWKVTEYKPRGPRKNGKS